MQLLNYIYMVKSTVKYYGKFEDIEIVVNGVIQAVHYGAQRTLWLWEIHEWFKVSERFFFVGIS